MKKEFETDPVYCRCHCTGWDLEETQSLNDDFWVECPIHRNSVFVNDIKTIRFCVEFNQLVGDRVVSDKEQIWYSDDELEVAIEKARELEAEGYPTRLFRRTYSK